MTAPAPLTAQPAGAESAGTQPSAGAPAASHGVRAPTRDWWLSAAATVVVAGGLALYLLDRTRHEWFFVDEWEFLANRVGPHPAVGIMIPHNEHPSMIPILLWRVLFDTFGIQRYWPYMAVLLAFDLAVVAVVWVVSRLSGAGPVGCLVAAVVMATAGVGSENIVWAFQIGMVGSVAASWAAAALTDRARGAQGPGRLVLVWVVLAAGLACSAVSVPLLVLPFIVALARRGWRSALVTVSVPVVAFLAWYLRWGRDGVSASKGFLPLQLGGYVIHGIDTALVGLTGVAGTTAVAAVLVLIAIRAGHLGTAERALPTAGLAGTVALYAFISIGRAGLGDAQSQSSRYAYLTVALVLPAAAVGLASLVGSARLAGRLPAAAEGRARWLTWAVVGLCTLAVCGRGLGLLDSAIDYRLVVATQVRAVASAGNVLVTDGSPLLAGVGANPRSGHLDGAAMIRLHDLGEFRGLATPSRAQLAATRLIFQFRWRPAMTRAAFDSAQAVPAAAELARYTPRPVQVNPIAVVVRPGPFSAAPTILAGRRLPGGSPHPGCVSVAPTGGQVVVRFTPTPGAQAVYVLAASATTIHFGWAASGVSAARDAESMTPDVVDELSTIVGVGDLRISGAATLTVCPVP